MNVQGTGVACSLLRKFYAEFYHYQELSTLDCGEHAWMNIKVGGQGRGMTWQRKPIGSGHGAVLRPLGCSRTAPTP